MQTQWAQQLNPIIANPLVNGIILQSITLKAGSNTINHLLGQKLQGWYLIRKRASAEIYDTQDNNPTPQLTLLLTSDSPVVVDIAVF